MNILSVIIFLTSLYVIQASRILMILPLGSRSHKQIFKAIAESLVQKGNTVTIASMYSELGNKTTPYLDVAAEEMMEKSQKIYGDHNIFTFMSEKKDTNINSEMMKKVLRHLPFFCEAFLYDPSIRQHVWKAEKPDLIMLPAFMNECGLIAVEYFKVPFIYVTTSGLAPWTADLLGNPENPAFVPNQYVSWGTNMNLMQRVGNAILRVLTPYLRQRYILSPLNVVAERFTGNENVNLEVVESGVSLVLVNSHHTLLEGPRPLQPNVIEVGGLHCRPARDLTDTAMLSFIEGAPKGTIVFSLGSHVLSEQMPDSLKKVFVQAFSRLPYRVLWKWDGPPPANLTSNVMLSPWLPLQDLFGHDNVKAVISHGGLFTIQQAIYHGVPIVGFPLVSDQHLNIARAESLGVAVSLPSLFEVTEEDVIAGVTKVMSGGRNGAYRSTALRRSKLARDQPIEHLTLATFYVEHVIRHKGAKHLRSAAADMSFISYFLIDVAAVIILVAVLISSLTYFIMKIMYKTVIKLMLVGLKKLFSVITSTGISTQLFHPNKSLKKTE